MRPNIKQTHYILEFSDIEDISDNQSESQSSQHNPLPDLIPNQEIKSLQQGLQQIKKETVEIPSLIIQEEQDQIPRRKPENPIQQWEVNFDELSEQEQPDDTSEPISIQKDPSPPPVEEPQYIEQYFEDQHIIEDIEIPQEQFKVEKVKEIFKINLINKQENQLKTQEKSIENLNITTPIQKIYNQEISICKPKQIIKQKFYNPKNSLIYLRLKGREDLYKKYETQQDDSPLPQEVDQLLEGLDCINNLLIGLSNFNEKKSNIIDKTKQKHSLDDNREHAKEKQSSKLNEETIQIKVKKQQENLVEVQQLQQEKFNDSIQKQYLEKESAQKYKVQQESIQKDKDKVLQETAQKQKVQLESAQKDKVQIESAQKAKLEQESVKKQKILQESTQKQKIQLESAQKQYVKQQSTQKKYMQQESAQKQQQLLESAQKQYLQQEAAQAKQLRQEKQQQEKEMKKQQEQKQVYKILTKKLINQGLPLYRCLLREKQREFIKWLRFSEIALINEGEKEIYRFEKRLSDQMFLQVHKQNMKSVTITKQFMFDPITLYYVQEGENQGQKLIEDNQVTKTMQNRNKVEKKDKVRKNDSKQKKTKEIKQKKHKKLQRQDSSDCVEILNEGKDIQAVIQKEKGIQSNSDDEDFDLLDADRIQIFKVPIDRPKKCQRKDNMKQNQQKQNTVQSNDDKVMVKQQLDQSNQQSWQVDHILEIQQINQKQIQQKHKDIINPLNKQVSQNKTHRHKVYKLKEKPLSRLETNDEIKKKEKIQEKRKEKKMQDFLQLLNEIEIEQKQQELRINSKGKLQNEDKYGLSHSERLKLKEKKQQMLEQQNEKRLMRLNNVDKREQVIEQQRLDRANNRQEVNQVGQSKQSLVSRQSSVEKGVTSSMRVHEQNQLRRLRRNWREDDDDSEVDRERQNKKINQTQFESK